MTKSRIIGLIFFIAVCIGAILYFEFHSPEKKQFTYYEDEARRKGPCPGEIKTIESEGHSYQLTNNWYECHPVQTGDWVYYRFSFSRDPVPRVVIAITGDKIRLKKEEHETKWNLFVNEKLTMNSEKIPYAFGDTRHEPVLALYEKRNDGILGPREAVVFSQPTAGNLDSGMFGVVNADDFLGKLEPISK